ncbi:Myosin-like coiled-coil protein [Nesidiocoris tenuis]|uniref:Myosin-like coiled-coil protein n=1 Tax=Nesidiocoris tenuis TaxID=355587 RepID=A0ABN7AMS3_9HEMI|nr:Myosin-like coiled-coil protein [Nesidiocoris tenuis]
MENAVLSSPAEVSANSPADGVRNTPEKPGKPQNGTTPTKNVISPAQNAKISPAKPVDLTNSGKPAKSPKGIKDQAGAGPKSKDLGEITDAAGSAPETMPVSTTSPEGPKAASNSAPNETPVVSATPAAGANAKPANQNLVKVPCPNQPPSSPAIPAKGATPKSSSHSSTLSCSQTAKPIPSGCKQVTTGINSAVAGKPSDKSTKRNREDKIRKKDDKSIEHVFKALSNYETTEEKLGAMCQKYADIFNEHRMLQNAAKLCEKKNSILQREKEQLQGDHSKAILSRSRLENLCRELQRQNKAVKEECMLKIREEEEKKREVATKFQSTLTELGNLLAQNNDKNAKLRDDNLDMTTKLKNVCEQYERKEQHVEKLAKQMHLEIQLADAKFAKAKMEMAMEKETLLREKQQLLIELSQCQGQLEEMRTSEIALRTQIQLYNDKYDEFHKSLLQSNEAIGSFKQEMERMSKQIRKLEKETASWKSRYEAAHRTLLQMTEEKLKSDQNASASNRKLVALQGLCRSLQAQCTSLRSELKGAAPSTPSVSNDQEEELMNQVEKELNDSTPVEAGLPNDNSPCPRQLSMESAEKINGEIGNPCDDEIGKPGDSTEEPAEPEKIDLPEKQATLESNVVDEELSSLPAPTPNGDVGSDVGDNKNSAAQPVQQAKKNKAKKKNKK